MLRSGQALVLLAFIALAALATTRHSHLCGAFQQRPGQWLRPRPPRHQDLPQVALTPPEKRRRGAHTQSGGSNARTPDAVRAARPPVQRVEPPAAQLADAQPVQQPPGAAQFDDPPVRPPGQAAARTVPDGTAEKPGDVTKAKRTQQHPHLDVFGLAVKPTCINRAAVAGLLEHVRPRAIHVVTSTSRQCIAFRSWGDTISCHVQDALVPGLTKASVQKRMASRFGGDANEEFRGRTLAGWYLQQFLKLGAAGVLPGLSDYFLIWDMDMVPLRPLPLLLQIPEDTAADTTGGPQYQTLVNIGGVASFAGGYNMTYQTLIGRPLEMAPDGSSLVTHMLVVYKPFMAQLLAEIANTPAPASPAAWVGRILDALPADKLNAGFSEYATYLSWVRQRYPGSQRFAGRVTWSRYGPGGWGGLVQAAAEARHGLCCPTDTQIQEATRQGLEYCGWDVGHVPECNYTHPAFAEAYGVDLPAIRR